MLTEGTEDPGEGAITGILLVVGIVMIVYGVYRLTVSQDMINFIIVLVGFVLSLVGSTQKSYEMGWEDDEPKK